ncbi:PREDICTED: proton-coupled folate transporter-like [Nanorana parkeri]|uniref:proton-coupled folate transporter-like n=1 Tax=Nanorana parkeri TaxID=125878 RepID=UPI0008547492|nr:PREDICTED: proton-coupled folate transporter-like [Nanorana parkeri]
MSAWTLRKTGTQVADQLLTRAHQGVLQALHLTLAACLSACNTDCKDPHLLLQALKRTPLPSGRFTSLTQAVTSLLNTAEQIYMEEAPFTSMARQAPYCSAKKKGGCIPADYPNGQVDDQCDLHLRLMQTIRIDPCKSAAAPRGIDQYDLHQKDKCRERLPLLFLHQFHYLQKDGHRSMQADERKVCQELYNDTECSGIQKNKDEYEVVQSRGSYIMLIYIAIMSIMSVLPALILGNWSDKGSRRLGMILPSAFAVASGGLFIAIYCFKEMTYYWTFAAAALIGISGGHVSMFLSVFSYLADITENSQRTFRMGIAESMVFIGGTSGFLLGGTLLQHSTFTIVFGVYCGCNLLAALYVLFWLQESRSSSVYSKLYEEYHGGDDDCSTSEVPLKRSFITYIKGSFSTICKKREGHNRMKFHLILISVFLINICNVGEQSITLMYVSYPPRSFNNELYGWYTASKMLISGICLLFTFHWLLKHVEETKLARVGVIMRTISFLLLAFSTTKWMIFLSGIIHAPSGYTMAVLRSVSSKIAHPNEQGAMFSIMASVETICLLIGAAIFNGLYPATLSTFPGMCFIIMATFQFITFVIIQ